MNRAHLYLAGCGPYSEALTTSALIDTIASVDVILYDRLINIELLKYAKQDALIEYVGKDIDEKQNTQTLINEKILACLKQGKRVIRLKSGDPFLFGRGFEEYEIATLNNFKVTVIPGLSSSLSVATSIGLPLTLRDVAHGITILTGTNKDNAIPTYSYQNKAHTYVFLMSVRHFDAIADQMIESGFSKQTEALAISNGTYPNQQIVCGSLLTLTQKMKSYNQRNPAIIVISPTIPIWKQHYRPRILSTKIDCTDFDLLDNKYHTETTHNPLLTHQPIQLSSEDWQQLHDATTLILSSPLTVSYATKLHIDWHQKLIIAIGPKTKYIADQFFQNVIYDENCATLQSWIDTHQLDETCILTSSYGKDIRIETAYSSRIVPIFSLTPNATQLEATPYDAITVYSPSSLEALVAAIHTAHLSSYFTLPLFCFGKNVYAAAQKSNFTDPILIETNDHDTFYQSIHTYFKERFSL